MGMNNTIVMVENVALVVSMDNREEVYYMKIAKVSLALDVLNCKNVDGELLKAAKAVILEALNSDTKKAE